MNSPQLPPLMNASRNYSFLSDNVTIGTTTTATIVTIVTFSSMIVFALFGCILHCVCSFVVFRAHLLSTDVKVLLYNVSAMAVIATLSMARRAVNALIFEGVDSIRPLTTIDCIWDYSLFSLCVNVVHCSVVGIGVERWLTNRSYFKTKPEDPPNNDSWLVGALAACFCWLSGVLIESLFFMSALWHVGIVPPTIWCTKLYMISATPAAVRIGFPIFVVCLQVLGLVTFEHVSRQAQQMYDAYRYGDTQNLETRFYLKQSTRISNALRPCFRVFFALNICVAVSRIAHERSFSKKGEFGSSHMSALWSMWAQLAFQFSYGIVFPCALLKSMEQYSVFVLNWLCCLCSHKLQNKVDLYNAGVNENLPDKDNDKESNKHVETIQAPVMETNQIAEMAVEDLELQSY